MARRLSWSDVRGGLVACLVIGVTAVAILTFMRVGALHGATFPLYALVGEARGVTRGSEVWLSGQKIGRITRIDFRPPGVGDSTSRILISMEVLEEHRHAIHRDAVAQIRAGGSVIGPAVVYVYPGTMRTAALHPGDTIRTLVQADVEGATSQLSGAARELPAILADVRAVRGKIGSSQGTVGAFLNGPGLSDLGRARTRATRLMNSVSGGGSIGPILNGGAQSRAGRTLARADSVRTLIASGGTSLGRYRRDSTLQAEVADIRDQLTLVRATLDEPRGTVGRALHDSALADALGRAEREMTLLLADIKAHPARYLSASF